MTLLYTSWLPYFVLDTKVVTTGSIVISDCLSLASEGESTLPASVK
ncbi:hypothetical protein CLV60_12238 [Dyadobacter jiangsuensis]|uniref:Uncharacterized protein n=1 Tax=Dyadobacter jiangsuensis TaxID=1591085 RepID=A0A2P8FI77_9BACT|nr:hypothetical protein CLV60_12238 [Dyadobacter jiangsuensis]